MKTYEQIKNLKTGESIDLGCGPVGGCKVRRTKKGVIATNAKGNWYIRNGDIPAAFGNLNAIGLQNLEGAIKSHRKA